MKVVNCHLRRTNSTHYRSVGDPYCVEYAARLFAMELPPDDPEAWTDEQWMEWLHATEKDVEADQRVFAPRLSSAGGVVLGAAMMGLQKGIYGDVEKPKIVVEAEAKGRDDGMKIDLDPDDPSSSTVVVDAEHHDGKR